MFGHPISLRQCVTASLRRHPSGPLWILTTRPCLPHIITVANTQKTFASKLGDAATAPKKPRKRKSATREDKTTITQDRSFTTSSKSKQTLVLPSPKPRRRPVKATDGADSSATIAAAPKRRGRPPKSPLAIPLIAVPKARASRTRQRKSGPRVLRLADTSKHSNLETYLKYIKETNRNPNSSVHKGTVFEYQVADALIPHHFDLQRFGGAGDFGIDLEGQWNLPGEQLKVIIQCKVPKATPSNVRDLDGAVQGDRYNYNGQPVMAILASAHKATDGVKHATERSRIPMGFVQIAHGVIKQMHWNEAAKRAHLTALASIPVHGKITSKPLDGSGNNTLKHVTLFWKGKQWSILPKPKVRKAIKS